MDLDKSKRLYTTASNFNYLEMRQFARTNRNFPTEAEYFLWQRLKNDALGVRFHRQHVIYKYIVDFVCLKKSLIVEVDGAYHSEPSQMETDEARTFELQQLGFQVIRFSNEEVLFNREEVISKIENLLL